MKKLKRFSIFILIGILLFSLLFPACGKDNQNGNESEQEVKQTLFSLPEAYENGWLTEEDLAYAADLHKKKQNHPTPIDETLQVAILEDYAQLLNADPTTKRSDYTAEDILIWNFYGTYNGCSIVYFYIIGTMFIGLDAPTSVNVAGVSFDYSHYTQARYLYAYYDE